MQMALLHFLGTNVQWWASNGKWRRGGKIWGRRRRAQYVEVQKTVKYGLSAGQSQTSFGWISLPSSISGIEKGQNKKFKIWVLVWIEATWLALFWSSMSSFKCLFIKMWMNDRDPLIGKWHLTSCQFPQNTLLNQFGAGLIKENSQPS